MLICQKDLFELPEDITYLNCSYMSPQLRSVTAVGMEAVVKKQNPTSIQLEDFFEPVDAVKAAFAKIINSAEPERIAIIPAVSYGMANVAKNVSLKPGEHILLVGEQFPSNYYIWKRLADDNDASVRMVEPPSGSNRTANWNAKILEAINEKTALVAMAHVHWADGTQFDLEAIRQKSREQGALLVIDGTQSVGALPFDVQKIQPDALICAGYKWLMGPYSMGMAYYGSYFDGGIPLEENWINRLNSEDFRGLVNYQPKYKGGANRYSVGEQSNFVLIPMMRAALEQVVDWGVENIQAYGVHLAQAVLSELLELGCRIEADDWRCGHLFGVRLPENIDADQLKDLFVKNKVFVSVRGDSIRVSPHLYNDASDFQCLLQCFQAAATQKNRLAI